MQPRWSNRAHMSKDGCQFPQLKGQADFLLGVRWAIRVHLLTERAAVRVVAGRGRLAGPSAVRLEEDEATS
jgi:hypothetical protein